MDKRLPKLSKEEKRKRRNKCQVKYTKTPNGRIKKKEQNRRYRARHKKKLSKYNKNWRSKHPNYMKNYYNKLKEKQ